MIIVIEDLVQVKLKVLFGFQFSYLLSCFLSPQKLAQNLDKVSV